MCTTIVGYISLIAWRLVFGGICCPPEWCHFSKITTNVSNDLLACEHWDPSLENSPAVYLIPSPKIPDLTLPLTQARESDVIVHPAPESKNDVCVDNIFGNAL